MVKSTELNVTVSCTPIKFQGIGCSTPVNVPPPCVLKIYTKVTDLAGNPIVNLEVGLYVSTDKGYSFVAVGWKKTDSNGEVEIPYNAEKEGEYIFAFHNVANQYCAEESDWLRISILKHTTDLTIGASPSNPAMEQYYTIYGRLTDRDRDNEGIDGKPIILYENGVKIATLTTYTFSSYKGWYEKKLKKSTTGQFKYEAEFQEDQSYKGCEERLWLEQEK